MAAEHGDPTAGGKKSGRRRKEKKFNKGWKKEVKNLKSLETGDTVPTHIEKMVLHLRGLIGINPIPLGL